MNIVIQIIAFLFVIALLVFIHEAGHFFVARWRRVWVHQFAVGFGPAIWKRKSGETEYSIRLFPLGGFVRMAGEDRLSEEDKAVPADRLFTSKKPMERMAIVAAGPLANIIGAILLQIIIVGSFGVGYPEIAGVLSNGASEGKLEPGDKIIEINGEMIYSREQTQRIVRSSGGKTLQIKVVRGEIKPENYREFTVTPKMAETGYLLGIEWGVRDMTTNPPQSIAYQGSSNLVQSLSSDAFLAKNGLQVGDRIVTVDGTQIFTANQFVRALNNGLTTTQKAQVQVIRNGQAVPIGIEFPQGQGIIEVMTGFRPEVLSRSTNIFETIRIGFTQVGDAVVLMYEVLRSIFAGKASAGEQLSGPVGIANIIGQSINLGLMTFLTIVALLSLNLGLINLFPFPALDGSRIVFILVELIIRRPIPPEKEGMVHYIGFIILLALILLITFNDIKKLLGQ
jgi:regulator of sigma E protease